MLNNPPRKYVSFAVQMLGKSFKMMPVMIWGMIISGKSYSILGLFRCCFLLIKAIRNEEVWIEPW